MAKAVKTIGIIAGAVALVATGVGAIAGSAVIAGGITGTTLTSIGAIAGVVSGVASLASQALYKPPPARGSVTNVLIAIDPPSPYVMGEGLFGGVLRHDIGYGKIKDVPNPYRLMVTVYSHGGPIHSISPRVELGTIGSWYSGFLYTDTQIGACPESTALAPHFAGAPGWGASSKLSGQAAIAWNMKFDKDGKVYASGVPRFAAYGKWVLAYDPRKDSSFPGGSGSHRVGVETTYEWTQNPALHAGTYAFGRFQNGKRVLGIGMPAHGIDWVGLAGWANVCDANGWTIFGPVFEPGNRWENLQEICAAGGCRQVFAGGLISWSYSAPKVALDTITDADIADADYDVTAQASWRDRLNSVVPKYVSPDHDWQLIADEDAVTIAGYVTEDGELKQVEWPFNLVKDGDQAAQLAAYKMLDSRELQPITLRCQPRMRAYRPGECLHLDLPELGLDTDAIILTREIDPATMVVTFTLIGETPEKHDFALGRTANPPPTPALKQTAEERDRLRWAVQLDRGVVTVSDTLPSAESSAGGDLAMTSDGRYWKRVEDNTLEIAGLPVEIGGEPVTITWTENDIQPVRDGFDAIADLAADAQATADGKVQTYYQPTAPTAHSAGDLWFDTDDGNKLFRSDGAAWIVAQDAEVGLAITAAAGAQATADGKVTTFYGESTPTPEGIGDLWFKPSTKALTRWTGSAWVAVAAPGVEDNADVTSAITGQAEIVINADYTGDTILTTLPKLQYYVLNRNGTDVTAAATWSVTVLSGTIAAAFPNPGELSLNLSSGAMTTATLRITAVYGSTTRTMDVRVTKQLAAAPSGGGGGGGGGSGSSATAGIANDVPTTTPVPISGELSITIAAGGNVALSANYNFTTGGTGSIARGLTTQWYEWNGSAYVAISGTSRAATVGYSPSIGEPGEGSNNQSLSGYTAASVKKFKLYAFNSGAATGTARTVFGTAAAVST